MLKGCQREMIVLQTTDSTVFENAYFVLRRESASMPHGDMLAEANRIVGAGSNYLARRRRRVPRGLLLFLGGALAGAAVFGLIMLIVGG